MTAVSASVILESFGGGSSYNSKDEDRENNKENREQNQLFQTRFEEGYDVPDPDYLEWLCLHPPDSLPEDPLPVTDKIPWQVIFIH